MLLEIWSDIACPFCFIGKRTLDRALADFPGRDEIEVRWRSFELAPQMPATIDGDLFAVVAARYGITREEARERCAAITAMAGDLGVELDLTRVRPGRTRDAHRLLQLAHARGLGDTLAERLFTAYFSEGLSVSDPAVLTRLAVGAGLDAGEVADVLGSDAFSDALAEDRRIAESFGLRGVPTFVLDRRIGLVGAQPAAVLLEGLERAAASA